MNLSLCKTKRIILSLFLIVSLLFQPCIYAMAASSDEAVHISSLEAEMGFGVEIEFTGMTRKEAANIVKNSLGDKSKIWEENAVYILIKAPDCRTWKIMLDNSFYGQKIVNNQVVDMGSDYTVELITPILKYNDTPTLEKILTNLKSNGAFVNEETGIHVHMDGRNFKPQTLVNLANLVYQKEDFIEKSLGILDLRMENYCKRLEPDLIERLNADPEKTFKSLADVWYEKYDSSRKRHYHQSRYHILNYHCFFNGNRSVELRCFNGTLEYSKIKSYILFALAFNAAALSEDFSLCSNDRLTIILKGAPVTLESAA